MARIVISEFMDERAVAQLRAAHDVLYDPRLVDDPQRLLAEAATADALVVRNRTSTSTATVRRRATRPATAWCCTTTRPPPTVARPATCV